MTHINLPESHVTSMIFSLSYIIKHLFIQIMCKNQLTQINHFQELMKHVDLPFVLTDLPE